MPETIQDSGLWHVTLAEEDLIRQAGLKKEDFKQDFGFFRYKGRPVVISHTYGEHLVVSMEGNEDEDFKALMAGFSKVIGYKPFCKYALGVQKGKKSVRMVWEIGDLDPKEERVLSYKVKSKMNLLGEVRLPAAVVQFINKKGALQELKSLKLRVIKKEE